MSILNQIALDMSQARRLLFITGAGISADSGLPTYRGIGGLYEQDDTEDGVAIEEALSGQMMTERPALTWKYLMQIEKACRGKHPNAAHEAIAALQERWDTWVITQNIDGFHGQAGSRNVIEMHGNMQRLECTRCDAAREVQDYGQISLPPTCPDCGAMERPAVVLFGEMLPEDALASYYRELAKGFDMVFSVGTSSLFPYIYGPVEQAIGAGITTVEINPTRTHLSGRVDYYVAERAAVCLPRLAEVLKVSDKPG